MTSTDNRPTSDDLPEVDRRADYPVSERTMDPAPQFAMSEYTPANKLTGKVALVTGGDSGIGRAVAVAYAMEGADVAIVFNTNREDAEETCRHVERHGRRCLAIQLDISNPENCRKAVERTVREFDQLDILVNNAAHQMSQQQIEDIPDEQFLQTIHTNIGGTFWMTKYAAPHLKPGASVINTGSIVGITGNPTLMDYAATKGAIHNLTKSMATQLTERGIRVNCVAPGPIWTPLIPGTMPAEKVGSFGGDTPMERPGQPEEVAPAFVYFASDDSTFTSGAILEVTGGRVG